MFSAPRPTRPSRSSCTPPPAQQRTARLDSRRRPTAATGEPAPRSATDSSTGSDSFAWRRQWWPVSLLEDLPADRPQSMSLLGERLVIWPQSPGAYRVFADRCPHRLAPLSAGRLVDGTLACNYHGWRFDGAGHCQAIPQAPSDKEAAFRASPRACATAYHSCQSDGLLWVQLDETRGAGAPSVPPPSIPAAQHGSGGMLTTYQRDLPLDYNEILENVLDPSHFHVAHHGVNGANRALAQPEPFAPVAETTQTRPGHFTMATPDGRRLSFAPPAGAFYAYSFGNFDVLVVPKEPGHARVISMIGTPQRGPMAYLPRWWLHLGQNAILDGDALIQAQQRQHLDGSVAYARQVYAPATADRPALAFRRWLATEGGHGPFGEVVVPPPGAVPLDDRAAQHAAICSTCGPLLLGARQAESWGQAATVTLLGLAIGVAPRFPRLAQRLAALSLAILAVHRGATMLATRLRAGP